MTGGDFPESRNVRASHGRSAGQRFHRGEAKTFVAGRENESAGTGDQSTQVVLGKVAGADHRAVVPRFTGTGDDQRRQVRTVRFQQSGKALARPFSADEE